MTFIDSKVSSSKYIVRAFGTGFDSDEYVVRYSRAGIGSTLYKVTVYLRE